MTDIPLPSSLASVTDPVEAARTAVDEALTRLEASRGEGPAEQAEAATALHAVLEEHLASGARLR